ncbi:MAG: hypothetical protein HZB23_15675 [Deltaproteobacteria bacterium]|nr:hypothetical protein [Deltaproteobacteria bacterium]
MKEDYGRANSEQTGYDRHTGLFDTLRVYMYTITPVDSECNKEHTFTLKEGLPGKI